MFDERYFLKKIGILVDSSPLYHFFPFKNKSVRSGFIVLCFLGIFSISWIYWYAELDRRVLFPIQSLFWTFVIGGFAYLITIFLSYKQNSKYGILVLSDGLAIGDRDGLLFKFSLIQYSDIDSIQVQHSKVFSHKYLKLHLRLDQNVSHWNCGVRVAHSPILDDSTINTDLINLIERRGKI
jgi:hypothetical protein